MSLPIPSLPTDNLYKFCAISGLVLMLFAVTYPVQRLFDLQLALADAETETEVVSKRSEHLRIDVERLEEKQGVSSDEWSEANSASRALEMDTIKLIGARRKLQFQNYQTWYMFILAVMSFYVGYRLSRFGFTRWYLRVQKPADQALEIGYREGETLNKGGDETHKSDEKEKA